MKKLIMIGVVCLVAVIVAATFLSSPQVAENGEVSGEKQTGVAEKIKTGFQNILPGENKEGKIERLENSPHVVVIEPSANTMTAEDVVERMEYLKDSKEGEGIDFARWALFSDSAKYTNEEKEQFLETAVENLPRAESRLLLYDALSRGNNPAFFEKAITTIGPTMNSEELQYFVKDFLQRNPNADAKGAVINYSATRNIYIK